MGFGIPQAPMIALLNQRVEGAPKYTNSLIFFMLLGAKLTIARAWKTNKVSLLAAKCKISWIFTQEQISVKLLDRVTKFEATGEPWAYYVEVPL